MFINNPPKALILLAALICVTVLLAFGRVDETSGIGVIGAIVGYATGNGVAARNDEEVTPAIGRRHSDDDE